MHVDARGGYRGGRGGGAYNDRGYSDRGYGDRGGHGARNSGRGGGGRGVYGGGGRGGGAEPPQPGRILRTWDVSNIVQNRDEQNLRELEILLMQLPGPVRSRLQQQVLFRMPVSCSLSRSTHATVAEGVPEQY